jgi:hypothetical protein
VRTIAILAAAAALSVVLFVSGSRAQDTTSPLGAFLSHLTEERTDISVGVTRGGDYTQVRRRVEIRESVVVPEHYGVLVAVVPSGPTTVFWFRGGDNVLRNVVLRDADTRLYRLETNGSALVETLRSPL